MEKEKKVFSKIGLAIALTLIVVSIVQVGLGALMKVFLPSLASSGWSSYILISVIYIIGLPLFFSIVKSVPNSTKRESKKLSVKEIIVLFFITYSAMIIANIFTLLCMRVVTIIKGGTVINPITTVVGKSSVLGAFIFAGILSPIVEEIIFRGIMLNKLKCYGDKVAIITTAVLFGLFHANFSQFFYAAAIGLVLAYVATKTGTIKYTIILHIMVNMMGNLAMFTAKNKILAGILGLCVIVFVILGIIFFFIKRKDISLSPAEVQIEEGKVFKTTCANFGMIFNFAICMLSMIIVLCR